MRFFLTTCALILSLALGGCFSKENEKKTEEEPWFLFKKQLGVWGLSFSKERMSLDSRGDIYVSLYADGNSLFKYDRLGNMLWKKELEVGDAAATISMAVDALDNACVMGRLSSIRNPHPFMLKYDSQGRTLMDNRVELPASHGDPHDMAVDSRGNFYILATKRVELEELPYNEYRLTLFKIDNNGYLIWQKDILDGRLYYEARLAVDSLDNIYILNEIEWDFFKYDAFGDRIWKKRREMPAFTQIAAMFADKKDNIYIAGWTWGGVAGESRGGSDIFWFKYNADGALLTESQWGTPDDDKLGGASIDARGNLHITGYSGDWDKNNQKLFVLKYDVEGKPAGERMYGKPGKNHRGLAIAADEDGYIYIVLNTHRDHTANERGRYLIKLEPMDDPSTQN